MKLVQMVQKVKNICLNNVEKTNTMAQRHYKFAYIEPVRACPVKCIPCPVGRNVLFKHPVVVLDLEIARRCFAKLRGQFGIDTLIMGNWGEPLLHPQFPELVQLARSSGFRQIEVSTSLSVKCDMASIIGAGLDCIQISMSGITKDVYNQSHRFGDFDLIFKNLESLVSLNKVKTTPAGIVIRWHRYHHNEAQFEAVSNFCKDLGLGLLPYFGHLGSIEAMRDWSNHQLEEPLKSFVYNSVFTEFIEKACILNKGATNCKQSEFVVLDADGSLVFCCSCYKNYKTNAPFLAMSASEIESFKSPNSTICSLCLGSGWSGYMNRPKTLEEYDGCISLGAT
ncbi:radical SAM domain iron-sulfur cluster-binding oxidoreductase [Geotalea daltonii FRC-32]|uniref:Radical SAM domain iron-sulfur cluster-binding oxidoreductase n=1 Tax=Geotalea daltonii (strain DSM 22248 / JCM 15807 / FRC-32) TaxID=316067 RepID=B9M551_GEODF|nr:radical SAM protein [Geotalea daltonii]ACM19806.1 radical SAM domain iron-sulfur cluster-binding oxidoreductase [Geotalea daltonii FRC-32]